jgi:RNA polymerase sigma-70 factor (TIGR02943 family)
MDRFTGEDLVSLRREMVRFAALQLRDPAMAEDVVQEALAAAVGAQERFQGRSSFRTWVFTILKNKLVDLMRDRWNQLRVATTELESDDDEFDALFRTHGHWNPEDRPVNWGEPEKQMENQEFWRVLQACLDNLPEATARIFTMREVLGLEVEEICKELSITPSNCWVVLHRARMGLRLCLQKRWFQEERQ